MTLFPLKMACALLIEPAPLPFVTSFLLVSPLRIHVPLVCEAVCGCGA